LNFDSYNKTQAIATVAGAVAGLTLCALVHGSSYNPGLFLSCVIGGWTGVGLYALLSGEVTLGGRGGRGARTIQGWKARAAGFVIVVSCVTFIFVVRTASH